MSTIYLTITLTALAALAALAIWWLSKRRKQQRTERRLMLGRRRLLDEEIELRQQELTSIDDEAISALRQQAEDELNLLNITLVERQAHLLNYADLSHLQECKLELMPTRPAAPLIDSHIDPHPEPAKSPPKKTEPAQPTRKREIEEDPKDRAQVENQLLDKISQLNKGPKRRK